MSEEEKINQPTGDNQPSTEENKTVAESLIDNNQPPTNMEVHNHTHPGHHKKTWKDYFWEFLMLFLAVFCGFLAEYLLEHKIEKDRAEKYMHDMVVNLKNDTARCKKTIEGNVLIGRGLDSLRNEIKEAIKGNIHSNRLYSLRQTYNGVNYIAFNMSAITQLKNAGNLRLVNNDTLVINILQYYDRKLRAVQEASEDIIYFKRRLEDAYEEFLDASYYDKALSTECSLIFSATKPRNTARKSIKNSSRYSPHFFLWVTWCGCLCTSISFVCSCSIVLFSSVDDGVLSVDCFIFSSSLIF